MAMSRVIDSCFSGACAVTIAKVARGSDHAPLIIASASMKTLATVKGLASFLQPGADGRITVNSVKQDSWVMIDNV